jgi:hypothetical protein
MELEQTIHSNNVSIAKLKDLRDVITDLEICEQAEILKIVEKNNIKFTENKNGVFINMNKLNDKSIEDIETFLEYIQNNYKKNLI